SVAQTKMFAGAFSSAVGSIFIALLVLAALAIYLTVIGQISARRSTDEVTIRTTPGQTFGLPEASLAAALILFLLLNIVASFGRSSPVQLNGRDLVANFLLSLFVV